MHAGCLQFVLNLLAGCKVWHLSFLWIVFKSQRSVFSDDVSVLQTSIKREHDQTALLDCLHQLLFKGTACFRMAPANISSLLLTYLSVCEAFLLCYCTRRVCPRLWLFRHRAPHPALNKNDSAPMRPSQRRRWCLTCLHIEFMTAEWLHGNSWCLVFNI